MPKPTKAPPELDLTVEYLPTSSIKPDPKNARKHPPRQLAQLKAGIGHFGFAVPVLIDENSVLIAGHARLEAAQSLGMPLVPTIRIVSATNMVYAVFTLEFPYIVTCAFLA